MEVAKELAATSVALAPKAPCWSVGVAQALGRSQAVLRAAVLLAALMVEWAQGLGLAQAILRAAEVRVTGALRFESRGAPRRLLVFCPHSALVALRQDGRGGRPLRTWRTSRTRRGGSAERLVL